MNLKLILKLFDKFLRENDVEFVSAGYTNSREHQFIKNAFFLNITLSSTSANLNQVYASVLERASKFQKSGQEEKAFLVMFS